MFFFSGGLFSFAQNALFFLRLFIFYIFYGSQSPRASPVGIILYIRTFALCSAALARLALQLEMVMRLLCKCKRWLLLLLFCLYIYTYTGRYTSYIYIYMPLYIHMHSITFLRDLRLFFFLLCSRRTLTNTAAAVSFGNPTKKCHRLLYCCHCDIVKKIYYNTVQKRVFVDYSAPYYNLYRTRKTISYIVM